MVQFHPSSRLPTAEELPETDFRPVDNELQYLIPVLLRSALVLAWADRPDWFFGVNMGIYAEPYPPAICPDAFLALCVPRYKSSGLRLSYVLWEEQDIMPLWVLEIVSRTAGGEYTTKMEKYAKLGVAYYTIYNPQHWQRDRHEPFEVYQLQDEQYVRVTGNPVWIPPIGLAVGVEQGQHDGWTQDWLYWFDQQGNRYPVPDELIAQAQQRADQAQQQADQAQRRAEEEFRLRQALLEKLRSLNIDPDQL